jgi:hypothetical protein
VLPIQFFVHNSIPKPTPTPSPEPTVPTSPTPLPSEEPQKLGQEELLGIGVTIVVVCAGLGLLVYLVKGKR